MTQSPTLSEMQAHLAGSTSSEAASEKDESPTLAEMMHALGAEEVDVDESPTLSEMMHALGQGETSPPTLAEMQHYLAENGDEAFLEHYGVKGMKWGVRRSQQLLDRVRGKTPREAAELTDEYNQRVGGINSDRAGAKAMREMSVGSVVVVDTGDGPTVVSKQKDGSFRKINMAVDAQNALRTTGKDPAEMSTREMNDAVKRAQAIEAYNKIFNPTPDNNADLKAQVEQLKLQREYSSINAAMNPSNLRKTALFIASMKPAYDFFIKVDKQFDNAASDKIRQKMGFQPSNDKNKPKSPKAQPKGPQTSYPKPNQQKPASKNGPEKIYNITSMPPPKRRFP